MKNRKLVAWGIIVSIAIAFINEIAFDANDGLYTLAGLGFMVFGIWASVILLKYEGQ